MKNGFLVLLGIQVRLLENLERAIKEAVDKHGAGALQGLLDYISAATPPSSSIVGMERQCKRTNTTKCSLEIYQRLLLVYWIVHFHLLGSALR